MATSSRSRIRPLYVYMQQPGTAQWLTVGAYWQDESSRIGRFKYAPSYEDAGHPWSIDPINLPRSTQQGLVYTAQRYGGLHDVLRDACPDSWGQAVLCKLHDLPSQSPMLTFLKVASNADRWGGLAVGGSPTPRVAQLATPRLPKLQAVVLELQAMANRKPALDSALRQRLQQTPSLGGARPKATVQDTQGQYWLVKPLTAADTTNIPMLEHFAQSWGAASGMHFARTAYAEFSTHHTVVRVKRFDRQGPQRTLCMSAASMLQIEFPGLGMREGQFGLPSYATLAGQLRLMGAPQADQLELFDRMVFNAVCGNDDDHLRNHAVCYDSLQGCWRLSPAYDVVPNPESTPTHLALALNRVSKAISQDALLQDALLFGLGDMTKARKHLQQTLERIRAGFDATYHLLDGDLYTLMKNRLMSQLSLLS
ncbi:HipA domain-containing protein [Limnobacter humi]|uniref:HipA domain-containing protein n=1 Tax=Limnobacter humi TaxID=1778671 RepID=A0ABT1WJR1_9BURK|nr:HipA domain-containing protein [Limnobacter humi]MCQ8897718.1 HipA domain-containing protein [Limnobacter humi]